MSYTLYVKRPDKKTWQVLGNSYRTIEVARDIAERYSPENFPGIICEVRDNNDGALVFSSENATRMIPRPLQARIAADHALKADTRYEKRGDTPAQRLYELREALWHIVNLLAEEGLNAEA